MKRSSAATDEYEHPGRISLPGLCRSDVSRIQKATPDGNIAAFLILLKQSHETKEEYKSDRERQFFDYVVETTQPDVQDER